MVYIKITFTKGLNQDAYQEVDDYQNVVRITDSLGLTLIVPSITESYVSDSNPPRPLWADDLPIPL